MSHAVPKRPMTAPIKRTPQIKAPAHLVFIRGLPCVTCSKPHCTEAAHIRMPSLIHGKAYTGKATKPSDRYTVPLCNDCHREQHSGSEDAFWSARGIAPVTLALMLHGVSGDQDAAQAIIQNARLVAPIYPERRT